MTTEEYIEKGDLASKNDEVEKALEFYTKAIEQNPRSSFATAQWLAKKS